MFRNMMKRKVWFLPGYLLFQELCCFLSFLYSLFSYVHCFLLVAEWLCLQVALFPLLRVTGGEEHFAFNNVIVQLVFGIASFLSPFVYSFLVSNLNNQHIGQGFFINLMSWLTPHNLAWVSIYWIFAFISFLMVAIILLSAFSKGCKKRR